MLPIEPFSSNYIVRAIMLWRQEVTGKKKEQEYRIIGAPISHVGRERRLGKHCSKQVPKI